MGKKFGTIKPKSKKPMPARESKPLNRSLSAAKAAKQDEFYTQYIDIQKEVEAFLEHNLIALKGNDQCADGDFRSDHVFRRILP